MKKRYLKRWLTYIYLLMMSMLPVIMMYKPSYSADKIHISINKLPNDINKVMNKPIYKNAIWGLRVVDLDTGNVLLNLNSTKLFYIGSVRKIFSVGELLDERGADYQSLTTVHYDGIVRNGNLSGNLVLIASGDLTMGGRTLPDGHVAITEYDHNEANSLGNAVITQTNLLAGYQNLAKQVYKTGIHSISGDIVIDDRLFDPFNFRSEFDVTPIFINDDVVDVVILPGLINDKASVSWPPHSASFTVINQLLTVSPYEKYNLELEPQLPACIGKTGCSGIIKGHLPANFIPPLTNNYPLVQTFRITKPSNYARTIFIEALQEAGVDVSTIDKTKENPTKLLKSVNSYNKNNKIATLKSLPYGEHAKYILKVSYNIGADTSLVLYGLTKGVRSMTESLNVEKKILAQKYGILPSEYQFVDGSGGGETKASNMAIIKWLMTMSKRPVFNTFYDSLPILAVDGSLGSIKKFQSDPTLSGATGFVHAKTGTYVLGNESGMIIKGRSLAGYIISKKNRRLAFALVVNNIPIQSLDDLFAVSQDQGIITSILWRNY
ncbi:D-alanyl-D-alanine carboxypeptidase/D-alanyl-D-alanine-endopeptidase [Legionella pneumophila]|nr:D-alanyl-D-alanine carboxypeptidase [Legionella pneumophila]AMP93988.1 peptidase S13 [Legionella pneumophila subsp. pascullei]AMP96900.1 peptidase S13 [Legionella pneumophila subsp. pascullei]HDU8259418.1 D-alanyl-D-alanine carboxypeptidase [Legionella pneumophila]